MKKISLLLSLLLSVTAFLYAQSPDEKMVAAASEALRKALVDGDKKVLDDLTTAQLSYGHSSGKIENKAEFIEAAVNGPVDLLSIDITDQTIRIVGDNAIVRHTFFAKRKTAEKEDEIKLIVLQVWKKQTGKWKLLARQGVKIG